MQGCRRNSHNWLRIHLYVFRHLFQCTNALQMKYLLKLAHSNKHTLGLLSPCDSDGTKQIGLLDWTQNMLIFVFGTYFVVLDSRRLQFDEQKQIVSPAKNSEKFTRKPKAFQRRHIYSIFVGNVNGILLHSNDNFGLWHKTLSRLKLIVVIV